MAAFATNLNTVKSREDVVSEIAHAFASREFAVAMQLCEGLMANDAKDTEAMALHTWASVRAGDANEDELRGALARMEEVVSSDRMSAQAIYHRGLIQKRLGNIAIAVRDFARAMVLNPKHEEAQREVTTFATRV